MASRNFEKNGENKTKLQTGRKYLYIIYSIRYCIQLYPEFIKISYNSIRQPD